MSPSADFSRRSRRQTVAPGVSRGKPKPHIREPASAGDRIRMDSSVVRRMTRNLVSPAEAGFAASGRCVPPAEAEAEAGGYSLLPASPAPPTPAPATPSMHSASENAERNLDRSGLCHTSFEICTYLARLADAWLRFGWLEAGGSRESGVAQTLLSVPSRQSATIVIDAARDRFNAPPVDSSSRAG